MNNITLYSTGCPKCNVLKSKLDSKKIHYDLVTDIDQMKKMGFLTAPMLKVDDNTMNFGEAVKYINNLGEE